MGRRAQLSKSLEKLAYIPPTDCGPNQAALVQTRESWVERNFQTLRDPKGPVLEKVSPDPVLTFHQPDTIPTNRLANNLCSWPYLIMDKKSERVSQMHFTVDGKNVRYANDQEVIPMMI